MKRILFVIILVMLVLPVTVMAGAGGSGFNGVVRSIEGRYHAHAMRIPLLGLISFVSRTASHGAVGGIHVATFEQFNEQVDSDELNNMVREKLGAGWEPFIRQTSNRSNEQTLIFAHPEGERMGLFIVDHDGSDLDVVQVSVDPKHLDDDIGQYTHHHHHHDSEHTGVEGLSGEGN